jgi:hypothetical protein
MVGVKMVVAAAVVLQEKQERGLFHRLEEVIGRQQGRLTEARLSNAS